MRKLLLPIVIIAAATVFVARLSFLQLFHNSQREGMNDVAVKAVYDYPERGYIYDRKGKLLVANQPAYDVMIIPTEVEPLDTTEFCNLLSVSKEEFIKLYQKAYIYSPWRASVFISQLSKENYAMFQEKMRKYKGFFIQKRSSRYYLTQAAANVLGYIGEVNEKDLKDSAYYTSGDLMGKQGVEQQYEAMLRGKKGVRYLQKDKFNRDIGPYKNGLFDTLPVQGNDIHLTIDIDLQTYGELLMQHKRGGIVAIEPASGELLALVSSPTYDPSMLVGRERSKNYSKLYYDSVAKPLYDRGLLAMYPPGSPFKVLTALAALQEGVIDASTEVSCQGAYYYGKKGKKMACHCGGGIRHLNNGIYKSCNSYFATIYRKTIEKYPQAGEGFSQWEKHIRSFGLGDYLGYDLPIGKKGNIPTTAYYDAVYGKGKWYATNTLSNAIGQGEILTTPIQLANITAAIANRGYYYTPHIIKKINHAPISIPGFTVPKKTTVQREYFEPIIQGMFDVYNHGTAQSLQIPGIEMAGKTGTAENFTKINGKITQLTDHSIFIAFAPVKDPKIAIAVFVENGYWGNRWAGKIAGLLAEKYLKGYITRKDMEDYVLNGSLEDEYEKMANKQSFGINE